MALVGKLIAHVEMNSGGKVLHDLLRHKPHDVASICPDKVHACDLVSGQRGAVGSTISWHYTHVEPKQDGKQLGTWTFEFEKPNVSVPYPTVFMDYLCDIIKDMDNHCIPK
ncbi:hypothetical protein OSB04_018281 [Centaurea solstitialis]|uniref:Bet v I/Major latex protein domain-containing protein n=1 Tax=Centaurea solstitialis TaxID=347529 RepID=A0AA38THR1_9ASTR|nr:hypothetical protein OSB04_018281 [Centaurea solstitialis]